MLPARSPRLEPPPQGVTLAPAPPSHVVWLRVASARVLASDRNSRPYDEGGLPDPIVVVSASGRELLRSTVADDTLEPAWAGGPSGNVSFPPNSKIRVDVLDSDGLTSELIHGAELPAPSLDDVNGGFVELLVGPSTVVRLQLEPAHALYGVGFEYDHRSGRCAVTNVFEHGPAARAGVRKGDRIVAIDGAEVATMRGAELRSLFGSIPMAGLQLQLQHRAGTTETVQVVEGPIYPLLEEYGPLD